jgi:hypothetical protein
MTKGTGARPSDDLRVLAELRDREADARDDAARC